MSNQERNKRMQTVTAIGAALKKAGRETSEMRLFGAAWRVLAAYDGDPNKALRAFINGELLEDDELLKTLALRFLAEAAAHMKELPGEGHSSSANEANLPMPSARQPNGDDEAKGQVPKGRRETAKSSPPQGDGAGHARAADEGHPYTARPSPTEAGRVLQSLRRQHQPTAAQIKAMGNARNLAARAILKIDGQDIRELTVGRCRSLLARTRTENYVLSVIVGRLSHLPDDTVVGSVLNDGDLTSIAAQGKEFGNAA